MKPGQVIDIRQRSSPSVIIGAIMVCASFGGSLVAPAVYGRGGFFEEGTEVFGWQLLIYGCSTSETVGFWLCNPLLIFALAAFYYRSFGPALLLSLAACSLSSVLLFRILVYHGIPTISGVAAVFHDGQLELRIGVLLWIGSQWLLLAFSFLMWITSLVQGKREGVPGMPLG